MEERKYCVYTHTNKINNKKYIGITSQVPENRWREGKGYYGKHCKFYHAILKYGWDNFIHDILFVNLTLQEANQLEIVLIQSLKTYGNFGYNTDLGGKNSEWTEERKNSIRGKNNSMYGKTPWNKGIPKEQSPVYGRKCTDEEKRAISEKNSGRLNGMYGKIPVNAVSVKCMETNQIFNSMREAGDWLAKIKGKYVDGVRCRVCDRISEHLRKGNSECLGYHWDYIER